MAKFDFYQDRKVTSWERTTFAVEAKDYREAVDIVKSWQGTLKMPMMNASTFASAAPYGRLRNVCCPKKMTAGRHGLSTTITMQRLWQTAERFRFVRATVKI